MTALQIKDCPDEVYQGLRESAERDNRSISQQMLTIIQLYLESQKRQGASAAFSAPSDRIGWQPDSNYVERHAPSGSYIAKRKAAFLRIGGLPPVAPREDGVAVADLVRESREEAR